MSALFKQGFFVRVPAWHKMGIVLEDYPDRETAMQLAGHDFDIVVLSGLTAPVPAEVNPGGVGFDKQLPGWTAHLRSDTLELLHVHGDTYETIPNSLAYDIAEILFDQGFQYDTGVTLDGGRTCAITLLLDEPIQIEGDESIVLPYGCLSWAHDGTASLKVRSGTIRQVCANTVNASEAEGKRLGTDFTFRHTKNVKDRIEDAKEAIKGVRAGIDVYRKIAEELAGYKVTPLQRDLFVSEIVGDKNGQVSNAPVSKVSQRVKDNVERERHKVNQLFMGQTIPEAHQLTGYGLWLAGGEYFDHLRGYRSDTSYVKRTLLSDNSAKAQLTKTVRELVAA